MTYSYSSPNRLLMPSFRPGVDPFANENGGFDKEYANAAGGTRATASITTTLAVGSVPGDRITYIITPVGMAAFSVVYTVANPKPTGAALQTAIRDAIIADSRLAGLGTWTSDATKIDFSSREVGQRIAIAVDVSAAVGTAVVTITQGQGFGQAIGAGLAVVTDPSVVQVTANGNSSTNLGIAFLPTQDLNDVAATQKWAGVNLNVNDENAISSSFPAFSSEFAAGPVIQTQLAVRRRGPVTVQLETPFLGGGAIPALTYRFAANGSKTSLGIFNLGAGTGLAAVPVRYSVVKITNNGMIAIVDFSAG